MVDRQKRRKEKAERIAAAAKTIFFNKGYFASTMDEIAREAGVSKGSMYPYFKNKDELYVSLMLPMMEKVTRMLLDIEKDLLNKSCKTGDDLLIKIHESFVRLYQEHQAELFIYQVHQVLDQFKVVDTNSVDKLQALAKRNLKALIRIFSDAINQNLLPEDTVPLQLSVVLWDSFVGIIQAEGFRLRLTHKWTMFLTRLDTAFQSSRKPWGRILKPRKTERTNVNQKQESYA